MTSQLLYFKRKIKNHLRYKPNVKILVTAKDLNDRYEQLKHKCPICNVEMTIHGKSFQSNLATLDRTIPYGDITINNFDIICFKCNKLKSDYTLKDFFDVQNKLLELEKLLQSNPNDNWYLKKYDIYKTLNLIRIYLNKKTVIKK